MQDPHRHRPGPAPSPVETATGRDVDDWRAWWVHAPGAAERYLLEQRGWLRTSGEWLDGSRGIDQLIVGHMEPRQSQRIQ
jgi:hypothetical protein